MLNFEWSYLAAGQRCLVDAAVPYQLTGGAAVWLTCEASGQLTGWEHQVLDKRGSFGIAETDESHRIVGQFNSVQVFYCLARHHSDHSSSNLSIVVIWCWGRQHMWSDWVRGWLLGILREWIPGWISPISMWTRWWNPSAEECCGWPQLCNHHSDSHHHHGSKAIGITRSMPRHFSHTSWTGGPAVFTWLYW